MEVGADVGAACGQEQLVHSEWSWHPSVMEVALKRGCKGRLLWGTIRRQKT